MNDKANQRGMTLVEVIIATAISSLIISGLGTAIYMIINVTERGNDEASALYHVRNATYHISSDAQMASTTDLIDGADPVDSLSLEWTDGFGNSHSSSYQLYGTDLQRNYDSTITTVARYVSSVEFSISGDVLTYYLESSPSRYEQANKETTGTVYLRPDTQS